MLSAVPRFRCLMPRLPTCPASSAATARRSTGAGLRKVICGHQALLVLVHLRKGS